MAVDLEQLLTLRDALMLRRADGIREYEIEGQRMSFRSDVEMAAAIADLNRQINQATQPRAGAVLFSSSKGL